MRKAPKDRARHPRRSPSSEIERRRANLAAGGNTSNYDRSHYADHAPEGFYDHTSESLDEMDKQAETAHEKMSENSDTVNLLDSKTYGKPPF